MRRARLAFVLACLIFLVAWFLPVVDGGTSLRNGGLPGWEALWFALSPIWDRGTGMTWWQQVLSVLSGLTNGWLVLSVTMLLRRRVGARRLLVAGLGVAALINAMWLVLFGGFGDLRIGYYLWTISFALLAAAAWGVMRSSFRSPRSTPASAATP
jgi:hypothetical protein